MPGMFDGYKNLNNIYNPNNTCIPNVPTPDNGQPKKPYIEYNAEGKMVGYWWYQGNTMNLEFDIDGEVTYTEAEVPEIIPNVEGIDATTSGGYISAEDFLKDKIVTIKLYNFRHEVVKYKDIDGKVIEAIQKFNGNQGTKFIFVIDELLASQLGKSNYYCSLTISTDGYNETVFYQESCALIIK